MFLMMFTMFPEGTGISVLLSTTRTWAGIGLRIQMSSLMFRPVTWVTECLFTTWMLTDIRSLSSMRSHMNLEVFQTRKSFVTWCVLSKVFGLNRRKKMRLENTRDTWTSHLTITRSFMISRCLETHCAFVWFFARMNSHVNQEFVSCIKRSSLSWTSVPMTNKGISRWRTTSVVVSLIHMILLNVKDKSFLTNGWVVTILPSALNGLKGISWRTLSIPRTQKPSVKISCKVTQVRTSVTCFCIKWFSETFVNDLVQCCWCWCRDCCISQLRGWNDWDYFVWRRNCL